MKNSFLKFALFAVFFVTATPAWADPVVIDVVLDISGGDCTEGVYNCTLQEALTAAEDLPDVTINVGDGSYNSDATFTHTPHDSSYVLSLQGGGYDVVALSSAAGPAAQINVGASLHISGIQFFNSENGLVISGSGASAFDVTIEDCAFISNASGGLVIENDGAAGELQISDSLFQYNSNNDNGGGLSVTSSQTLPITLTGNTFSDNNISSGNGSGAYIYGSGSSSPFTATGNIFDINSTGDGSGGNLYVQEDGSDSPIIFGGSSADDGNTVSGGGASTESGGIWLRTTSEANDSYIECSHNTLTNNSSNSAGGYMLDTDGEGDIHVVFTYNTVTGNTANTYSGGYLYAKDGLVFEHNEFSDNTTGSGGAAWIGIDGVSNTADNSISHNTFINNSATADSGAGLFVWVSDDHDHGTLTLDGNFFSDNIAESGAVNQIELNSVLDAPMAITNNVIVNNTSTGNGGGLYIKSGAVTATVDFVNNTIANNVAVYGGGIYFDPNSFTANFYNNIIFGNTASTEGDDVYVSSNDFNLFTFNNNDFGEICVSNGADHCNDSLDFSAITAIRNDFSASDNIVDDPSFKSATDFELNENSPAIGAGDSEAPSLPSSDFDGASLAIPPDLGAYQLTVPAPVLSLSDTTLDFDEQSVGTDSDVQTVTITNTGTAILTITSISVSGDFSVSDTCDDTLEPDDSCEISIIFSPTEEGDAEESVTVETDADSSPDTVALTGIGTDDSVTHVEGRIDSSSCSLNPHAKGSQGQLLIFGFMAACVLLARAGRSAWL